MSDGSLSQRDYDVLLYGNAFEWCGVRLDPRRVRIVHGANKADDCFMYHCDDGADIRLPANEVRRFRQRGGPLYGESPIMNRETAKALRLLREHEHELENYDFRPGRRVPRFDSPAPRVERPEPMSLVVMKLLGLLMLGALAGAGLYHVVSGK